MRLSGILRYPVKGLAPESLPSAEMIPDRPLAGDRKFALAHRASNYDPANPVWLKRSNFVVVALSPKLATIASSYDDTSGIVTLRNEAGTDHQFDLSNPADVIRFAALVEACGGGMQPGPYELAHIPGGNLADRNTPTLSLHSRASHDAVSASSGLDLSPRRWRSNLWCDGVAPWGEFSWIGREISIGSARFAVTERIERCAAPSANTCSGVRDIDMPSHLFKTYGHRDFGVLCKIISGGRIEVNDPIRVLD
uniref:MOSC domain-containing protein n=1 Tax=Pararhizobium sp. IMCC3301 TaxID=3067904 RepID=UPI0027415407|nr:MOSC N-terminal beta barrel domain-containing protein [Pararhizobium sp. IMCC3301]